MPFKEYMRKNVFGPVEMRDTAFEPRADMAERLAIPYMPVRRRTGVFRPVDWVKADAWPAGVVYGTAVDQARWLMANVNGGVYKGRRIITESTFREMTRRQFDRFAGPINGGWLNETSGYGLAWWVSTLNGDTIIAHSGSVNGYTAFLAGESQPEDGRGHPDQRQQGPPLALQPGPQGPRRALGSGPPAINPWTAVRSRTRWSSRG